MATGGGFWVAAGAESEAFDNSEMKSGNPRASLRMRTTIGFSSIGPPLRFARHGVSGTGRIGNAAELPAFCY